MSATNLNLAGEADHRIANSLASIGSLVRLAARHGARQDPAQFLMEIADRIESVAALHRQLARSRSGNVRPRQFIEDICDRQRRALTDGDLSLSLDFSGERELPAEIVLPLGLLTLELLSNSLKYAHPAATPLRVSIFCQQTAAQLHFRFEDDGVGFPEGFDVASVGNLGMRFVAALCQKLRATPEWNSDELGVRFSLCIPL